MARPKGSRNTLVKIDYDVIGELAGVRGNTARAYAHRGEYDSRSLDSVLAWVNRRRAAQGLPLIGIPDGDNPAVSDDVQKPVKSPPPDDTWDQFLAGGLVYVPALAEFRRLYDDENR